MRLGVWAGAMLIASAAVGGCASPFAQRIGYDRGVADAPGTITLSDPKLHTREALINERAHDVAWIDGLITDSENPTKVSFKPELYRELEQISAFSAAIGAKFDPAAALSYRRATETGDVRQEIDVLKLQLQLDQLRRDAELFRAGFANQTAPVNTGAATLGEGGTAAPAPVSASAADQLKSAIDKLMTSLTSRLDADGKPVAATTVTSSPFDDFRDRSAYRDMLKSARNAAALDQLHDSGNARLIRLNFEATVLPSEKFERSLGAVQIRVVPPGGTGPTATFLGEWLQYLNTDPKFRATDGQLRQDDLVAELIAGGRFKLMRIGTVDLLLPVLVDGDGNDQDPADIFARSHWDNLEATDLSSFDRALGIVSSIDSAATSAMLVNLCTGVGPGGNARVVDRALYFASDRDVSYEYLLLAEKVARAARPALTLPSIVEASAKLQRADQYRVTLVERMRADPNCGRRIAQVEAIPEWKAFRDSTVGGPGSVRVYEVGPREQVQQISTVARSANSLALAASIAGSAPGSGVAADAAASYSRQAMGRATALERAPSVVGYSVAGSGVFGWVLGPRAVIDPKGHVNMEQMLKPYDLSVDLSVPGWWAAFELDVTTVWAPGPDRLVSGNLMTAAGAQTRRIPVPLVRTVADYDAFADYMVGTHIRRANIAEIRGGPVNACASTTLYVTGDNLWRAQRAFVLGNLLEGDKISITPDMRGIFLIVPPVTPLPNINPNRTLYIMTPLGTAESSGPVDYVSDPSGDGCKAPKPLTATSAPADSVTIEDMPALEFAVPASFTIRVGGTNLTKVAKVQLHGQDGVVKVAADGKSLTVDFDEHSTSSITSSDNTALDFLDKDRKILATRRVRTQRTK
jgi:hypothetical protein